MAYILKNGKYLSWSGDELTFGEGDKVTVSFHQITPKGVLIAPSTHLCNGLKYAVKVYEPSDSDHGCLNNREHYDSNTETLYLLVDGERMEVTSTTPSPLMIIGSVRLGIKSDFMLGEKRMGFTLLRSKSQGDYSNPLPIQLTDPSVCGTPSNGKNATPAPPSTKRPAGTKRPPSTKRPNGTKRPTTNGGTTAPAFAQAQVTCNCNVFQSCTNGECKLDLFRSWAFWAIVIGIIVLIIIILMVIYFSSRGRNESEEILLAPSPTRTERAPTLDEVYEDRLSRTIV